jgi:hypothetical protein
MWISGVITGFLNGLFGAGGGMVIVPLLERVAKLEKHKAHATAIAVILPISLVSVAVYIFKGTVPWGIVLYLTVGGLAGGFIGAKLLPKISTVWLRRVFALFILAAAIRMLI